MDLACASGLVESIRRNVNACGKQDWTDAQLVMSVVLLNLAGGECKASPPQAAGYLEQC